MKIGDEAVEQFIACYEAAFGESITPEQAQAMLNRLLHLYQRMAENCPMSEV